MWFVEFYLIFIGLILLAIVIDNVQRWLRHDIPKGFEFEDNYISDLNEIFWCSKGLTPKESLDCEKGKKLDYACHSCDEWVLVHINKIRDGRYQK